MTSRPQTGRTRRAARSSSTFPRAWDAEQASCWRVTTRARTTRTRTRTRMDAEWQAQPTRPSPPNLGAPQLLLTTPMPPCGGRDQRHGRCLFLGQDPGSSIQHPSVLVIGSGRLRSERSFDLGLISLHEPHAPDGGGGDDAWPIAGAGPGQGGWRRQRWWVRCDRMQRRRRRRRRKRRRRRRRRDAVVVVVVVVVVGLGR